jgi:hypothetical protein
VIPQVEIWRAEATAPQRPARHGHRMESAYVSDNNPVTMRLLFNPLATGKVVTITGATHIAVDQSQMVLHVPPTGECLVSLLLDDGISRGHITFSCEGQTTTLPVSRATAQLVAARENSNGGVAP